MNKQNLKNAMDRRLSGLKAEKRHVDDVLQQLEGENKVTKKQSSSLILVFAVIALVGLAVAATLSPTIDYYGRMHGQKKSDEMQKGTLMPIGQSRDLGDVHYEWIDTLQVSVRPEDRVPLDEREYENEAAREANEFAYYNTLYGTVRISPREGSNVILMPEDFQLSDPYGYHPYLEDLAMKAPEGTPSYLETAIEKDAKILIVRAIPEGVMINGELQLADIGSDFMPNPDGSISYYYEIGAVPEMPEYTINMYISNLEITRDGEWLQEGPNSTWLQKEWILTVKPEAK